MNKTKLCRYGEMIYRPNDIYIGRSFDLYGEFSEQEVQFFRAAVQPGQTVLDVGANIGAHSVALARIVTASGRVLAFEPQRDLFYALCGNVAQNNLRQVRCYLAAVGDTPGTIAVPELDADAEANYGGVGLADGVGSAPSEQVTLMRIDDLQLAACHFMKIDVEGMEERVLMGATHTIRSFRPLLYVEDDRPNRSEDLRACLFELGYELYVHRPPLYNPANFAGHRENVFGRIVSLNLFGHHVDSPSPIRPEQFNLERLERPAASALRRRKAATFVSFDEARRQHQAGNLERAVALYRQLLLAEPNNAQAWYLLGAACAQLGQLDEARSSLRQATGVNPRHAEAHNHLGVVLAQQASLDDAIGSFRRALELKPDSLEVLNNLGLALLRQDKVDDAIAVFQRALEVQPDDTKARHNLNRALRERGQFEELLTSQRQAVGQQPESAQAHNDLGLTLYEQGKLDEAADAFRQAIVVKPDLAEAHNNLGLVRASQGNLDEAITDYRRAIVLKPTFAEAHNNLGIALRQSGQAEAAVASCREAARLKPDLPEAHNNLGSALEEVGRYDEAITTLETALRIKPDFSKAHNNLGIAYWYLGRYDEASASYRKAIELTPEMAEAHNNLGNVLQDQGKIEEAAAAYRHAADLRPNYADPHWNQSLVWLLQGDFERGWAEYEWRWKLKSFKPRDCKQPVWDGSSLEGKTILLAAEQGLGDAIQFIRYAPLVRERAARVVVEVPRLLRQILATVPGIDELCVQGEALPSFDTYVTLLSLPRLLGTRLESIPANVPYVSVDPQALEAWRGEFAGVAGLKVGIAWQGSRLHRRDRARSIPLALFAPLAELPGVRLYSLQKDLGREQIAGVPFGEAIVDLGPRLESFVDTAAVMEHLDLVVCCDTSVGHLAGALGRPVWVALPAAPDWRWLLDRDDTPWYPSMRLFRQARVADWPDVFDRIVAALREKIGESEGKD